MPKTDLRKLLKDVYAAGAQPKLVQVPSLAYFMIDGHGDPNASPDFQAAIEALYSLSYTLKFQMKKADPAQDYVVMPLQGLWWAEDWADFANVNKAKWSWTIMIVQPPPLTQQQFAALVEQVGAKKELPALGRVRLETLDEGLAAQIMHLGPFSEEGPTIQRLHEFIDQQGYKLHGKHHEIYMSDPRRVPPEKWKTIIRQPCR